MADDIVSEGRSAPDEKNDGEIHNESDQTREKDDEGGFNGKGIGEKPGRRERFLKTDVNE